MKVTLYGSGYVGLITGVCMAQVGNDVLCVDTDEEKVRQLSKGKTHIHESGVKKILKENLAAGRIRFTTSAKEGVEHGLYQFITVNIPTNEEDGTLDLTHVLEVAKSIATHISGYRIIIGKSAAPVGTADLVKKTIDEVLVQRNQKIEFDMVANPEFIKVGTAIEEIMQPDRIIIGSDNPRTIELMRELYLPFNHNRDRVIAMDIRSAEMTKFAATALLATKISFMNELSNIAEILDADIEQVRMGIGSDPRIGYHFIYPGCGYGGSRFPKDIRALEKTAELHGYNAELLKAVESVNYRQKEKLFEKLERHFGDDLKDKTIALWGLAFKPNSGDMRGAASRVLMKYLWKTGAKVRAYDPAATENCKKLYPDQEGLIVCKNTDETIQGADALVIATEWQEFRSPDFEKLKSTLNSPVIVDGRNLYNPQLMEDMGFTYYGIGRGE